MVKLKKILFFFLFVLFFVTQLNSQLYKLGLPQIINYTDPNNPLLNEQIWDINKTSDGLMYFAASSYFLEFDGLNFRSVFESFNSFYLSFAIDTNNRNFYIGQRNGITKIELKNGKYLLNDIQTPYISVNYCWNTYILNGKVYYFVNNSDVLILDKNTVIELSHPDEFKITRGFKINNNLYAVSKNGIAVIENNKLKILNDKQKSVFNEDIRTMIDFNEDSILIGTRENNLYLMHKKNYQINKFYTKADKYLKNSKIYNGSKIDDDKFVITTLKKGVFIINKKGQLLGQYDKNNGLASDAVYTAFVDEFKNIWLGTGKGVSLILWNKPVRCIDNRMNVNSGIMGFNFFRNKLVVSTFNNFLYTDNNPNIWQKKLIPQKPSILYASELIIPRKHKDEYMLIGGYEKYQVIDKNFNIILEKETEYQPKIIKESPVIDNRFFVATEKIFSAYKLLEQNNQIKIKKLKEFINLSFNIDFAYFDSKNDLWLSHSNEIFLLDFDEKESLNSYNEYALNSRNCELNSPVSCIFEINKKLYISTFKGIKEIKNFDKKPADYKLSNFNKLYFINLNDEIIINFLETKNNYYFLCKNSIHKYNKSLRNHKKIAVKSYFEPFYSKLVLKNGRLWTSSKDKIIIIDTNKFDYNRNFKDKIGLKSFKINSHKEIVTYKQDSLFKIKGKTYTLREPIKNKKTTMFFTFFTAYYDNADFIKYMFFIDDESQTWQKVNGNSLLLRNLSPGKYTLRVKAINFNGEESDELIIKFRVRNPFYSSIYAFIFYFILLGFIIYFLARFLNKKIRSEKNTLEELVNKRTALLEEQKEELAMQSRELEQQKKIMERKNERLQIALVELKQLSLVAQKTNNSVLIIEQNGKFEWWNRGFIDLFEFKINKYSKLPLKKAHKKIRPDIYKEIKSYSPDKGTISYTTHERFENGEEIWYQTTINPVFIEEHGYTKFVVIDYNITPVKSAEKEIQKQKEIVQQSKNRFNKAVAELKLNKEEFDNLSFHYKRNLNYAKLIRNIFVNNEKIEIKQLVNHFIIDKPQEILSGDFIWHKKLNNNEVLIFIGDATGHQIRGSINSVIAISLLNDILSENMNISNNELIKELDKRMIENYNKINAIKEKDHLNLAVLRFNFSNKNLLFTSSKISMYLLRKEFKYFLYKYSAQRINIAGLVRDFKYKTQNIKLKDNDRIYISTDGWKNQFDKFGIKKYSPIRKRDFLLSIQEYEFEEQKYLIADEIKNWKGSFEQTDDILIFGVEINFLKFK